jgi:hypothetical protein
MLAIDYCARSDAKTPVLRSYKVAVVVEHPFLKDLDKIPHVPRAVKHIYRRATRLKYLFARDAFDFLSDMHRANDAWGAYLATMETLAR